MKRLKWWDKNFELVLLVFMLVLITVIMSAQVLLRKVFGIALPWAEALCCHFMIYMGLLGISCTLAEGNAIRFDVIVTFVSEKMRLIFSVIADFVTMITFFYLTPFTLQIIEGMRGQTIAALPYTYGFVYSVCAICVIIIDIRSLESFFKNIYALRHYKRGHGAQEVEGKVSES